MRLALAESYFKIGQIQGGSNRPNLEEYGPAEVSFTKAAKLIDPLYRAKPDDAAVAILWLGVHASLSDLKYRAGDRQGASASYLKLLPAAARLGRRYPNDVDCAKQEAAIHQHLATTMHYFDSGGALAHANRQIDLSRSLLRRFPGNAGLKQEVGAGLSSAAASLALDNQLERAAELYRESISLREELLKQDPHNALLQRNMIVVYGNYAALLGEPWSPNLGKPDEARAACQEGVKIARRLASLDAHDANARFDLAVSLSHLGTVPPEVGRAEESLALLREAISLMDPIAAANPKSFNFLSQLTLALEYAGHRLESLGHPREAAEQFQRSLDLTEPFLRSKNSSALVQILVDERALARIYAGLGDGARSLEFAQKAVAHAGLYNGSGQNSDRRAGHLAAAHFAVAAARSQLGDWLESRREAEQALALWNPIRSADVLALYQVEIAGASALVKETAKSATK